NDRAASDTPMFKPVTNATKLSYRTLGCVAGRLEFSKDRYYLAPIVSANDILDHLGQFKRKLRMREAVACYFYLADDYSTETVEQQIRILASMLSILRRDADPETLVNGGSLSLDIATQCPVTGAIKQFADFDVVAFCPRAADIGDDLYDPLMAAPALSANLNSDVYAFSLFTRDMIHKRLGVEPYQIESTQTLSALLHEAGNIWQRMAERTISNYIDMTDTNRCPTSLSDDRRHWYASHQDPAFAETVKELYKHEMPKIYTRRIIDSWMRHFNTRPETEVVFTPAGTKA
ncbi:hypothetical protein ACS8YF_16985, partial [Salinisphaera sp. SWV1]|uniref:hypothetical protein n=1 Tax=Salinisphaera sp. SWV1 TaxID=3454139 RepID=UPI003F8492E0